MSTRRRGVWTTQQGWVALAVISATALWRGVLLRGSFFNQDDYYLTSRASRSDLTWSFLVEDTAGHVNPAQQLVYWIVARAAPFEWAALAVFLLVLQMATAVVAWHVLSRMLPGSWVRIPLLVAICVAPLTLASTLWWSAAMGLWPPLFAMTVAILFLLRAAQRDRWQWLELVGCAVALGFGLLWHERAILIAPMLLGVAVCLADEATGWRRITAALRRWWGLWLALLAIGAGFLVAHSQLTSVTGGAGSVRQSLAVAWAFLAENVVPGLAAGPWTAEVVGGAVDPPAWSVVITLLLAVVASVMLLRRGGPARRWAFALLVCYVLSDLVLLVSGRGGFGRVIGLDSRYSADVVLVAALCVALGLRGASFAADTERTDEPDPHAGDWRRRALGVSLAYAVAAAVGTALLVPHFQNVEDRTYFTNLRNDFAANENQVLYDELVPGGILLPLLGEEAMLSSVLAPLPNGPVFDQPSADLRVVARDGRLARPTIKQGVLAHRGPVDGCGYPVSAAGRTISFGLPLRGKLVLFMGYFTDAETAVRVSVPGQDWSVTFGTRTGPNEMYVVVPDFGEEFRFVQMTGEAGSTVCITGVQAGVPEPA